MLKGKLNCCYKIDGVIKKISIDQDYKDNDLSISFKCVDLNQLCIDIKTSVEIEIESVKYIMKRSFLPSEKVFVNGFQSWTDSKEFSYTDKMTRISPLAKPVINKYALDKYGDYDFVDYNHKQGSFHGFTYGYTRQKGRFEVIGSLNEKSGYTVIYYHLMKHMIEVSKDIKGIKINGNYNLMNFCYLSGAENEVFDEYFELLKIDKPKNSKMNGWTSWYNYYEEINEEIILSNLNTIHELEKDINIFQIDDGYETFVGDWLDVDGSKFPGGLKVIADEIKVKGYKAGLWLAPFVCEKNSKVYQEHKDWILKNNDGSYVHAGHNWSGFYALDIYNPEVRNYIKKVFDTVLNDWGFDMVKLDFLYAISLIHYKNKSRGQIMCEGMEFLRECVGDKIILGCGVPLGPSFGLVDYCRIGCDVGLDWDDKAFMKLMHRERISTKNAITNSIYRRQLNGRGFINDPDVFILRDENNKLSIEEKELLAFINHKFGGLIFTSDDISKYSPSMMKIFDNVMDSQDSEIKLVEEKKRNLLYIEFIETDKSVVNEVKCFINLSNKQQTYNNVKIPAKSVLQL